MVQKDTVKTITKRAFLFGGLALGGGLVVGYAYLRDKGGTAGFENWGRPGHALNAWVKIAPDGQITVAVPRAEMGQGVYTSVAMLICEELEVGLDQVKVEFPALDGQYINAFAITSEMGGSDGPVAWLVTRVVAKLKMIATGGSSTIRGDHKTMPLVGAAAREMLIAEAADRWQVPAQSCRAERGQVIHDGSGQRITYGGLAEGAARRTPPENPKLKTADQYQLIGTPAPRIDIPDKVTGAAEFGIDVRLPNMVYATVVQCPVLGSKMEAFDLGSISDLPGIIKVIPVQEGLAIIAESYWQAKKAADALKITWSEPGDGAISSNDIEAQARQLLQQGEAILVHESQEGLSKLEKAVPSVDATYEVPYLAHTCMEPMNCTVLVEGGKAEVWAGSQSPTMVAWGVAKGADIDSDDVVVHMTYMGGGFGRRIEHDFVIQAAQAARAVEGRPVKLVWSREEDVTHDLFRPLAMAHMRGSVDEWGKVEATTARVAVQGVNIGMSERMEMSFVSGPEADRAMHSGLHSPYYNLGAYHLDKVWLDVPVQVGNWRSVGHSHNGFFIESFVDELAHAAGQDPYLYRRTLLSDVPRHLAVLDMAALKAGWSQPLKPGQGRGIALHESFESIVAEVAEVTVSRSGDLSVDRVVCVIDCGMVVNPDTVEAQMQSGIVYGLSAVLYGEITFDQGRVMQQNFPDYDAVRLADMPKIETHIMTTGDVVGGVGEPSTPPIAPAVTNAIFRATGRRIRKLPLSKAKLV